VFDLDNKDVGGLLSASCFMLSKTHISEQLNLRGIGFYLVLLGINIETIKADNSFDLSCFEWLQKVG
jgi:hypothetical protein